MMGHQQNSTNEHRESRRSHDQNSDWSCFKKNDCLFVYCLVALAIAYKSVDQVESFLIPSTSRLVHQISNRHDTRNRFITPATFAQQASRRIPRSPIVGQSKTRLHYMYKNSTDQCPPAEDEAEELSSGSSNTHYQTLGVSSDATFEEIKSAYYKLAKKYHPDAKPSTATAATATRKRGSSSPSSSHKFLQISQAYEILRDPESRSKYDFQLRMQRMKETCWVENSFETSSPPFSSPFSSSFSSPFVYDIPVDVGGVDNYSYKSSSSSSPFSDGYFSGSAAAGSNGSSGNGGGKGSHWKQVDTRPYVRPGRRQQQAQRTNSQRGSWSGGMWDKSQYVGEPTRWNNFGGKWGGDDRSSPYVGRPSRGFDYSSAGNGVGDRFARGSTFGGTGNTRRNQRSTSFSSFGGNFGYGVGGGWDPIGKAPFTRNNGKGNWSQVDKNPYVGTNGFGSFGGGSWDRQQPPQQSYYQRQQQQHVGKSTFKTKAAQNANTRATRGFGGGSWDPIGTNPFYQGTYTTSSSTAKTSTTTNTNSRQHGYPGGWARVDTSPFDRNNDAFSGKHYGWSQDRPMGCEASAYVSTKDKNNKNVRADFDGETKNIEEQEQSRPHRPTPTIGSSIREDITVDFKTAIFGGKHVLQIQHKELCIDCFGIGSVVPKPPSPPKPSNIDATSQKKEGVNGARSVPTMVITNGAHRRQYQYESVISSPLSSDQGDTNGAQQEQEDPEVKNGVDNDNTCTNSNGDEYVECRKCNGDGFISKMKEITVSIPANCGNQIVRMKGQGNVGKHGGPTGDLFLHLHVKNTDEQGIFRRRGTGIYSNHTVSYLDAILGTGTGNKNNVIIQTPTVDGGLSPIQLAPGTQPFHVIDLIGSGCPKKPAYQQKQRLDHMASSSLSPGGQYQLSIDPVNRGNHHVTIKVEIPTEICDEERQILERLRELQDAKKNRHKAQDHPQQHPEDSAAMLQEDDEDIPKNEDSFGQDISSKQTMDQSQEQLDREPPQDNASVFPDEEQDFSNNSDPIASNSNAEENLNQARQHMDEDLEAYSMYLQETIQDVLHRNNTVGTSTSADEDHEVEFDDAYANAYYAFMENVENQQA